MEKERWCVCEHIYAYTFYMWIEMCVYTCSKKHICYRQSLLQADPEEMYSKRKKKKGSHEVTWQASISNRFKHCGMQENETVVENRAVFSRKKIWCYAVAKVTLLNLRIKKQRTLKTQKLNSCSTAYTAY